MVRALLLLACVLGPADSLLAQTRSPDPVDAVVRRLEGVLNTSDRREFPSLFAASVAAETVEQHALDLFYPGSIRTALFERGRSPLEGVPPGDGFRLVVEIFVETPNRARILTAGIDIRRPTGGDADSWRISSIDSMSAIDGLFKLRLNTTAPLAARNLELRSEDVTVALPDGLMFRVESDEGVTGVVLVGRGELRFSPAAASERGQLRIFAGAESLSSPFETAYIRFNPREYGEQTATATLTEVVADARLARRAQDVFRRQSPQSFSVDVADMSREAWHLLPAVRHAHVFTIDAAGRRRVAVPALRSQDNHTLPVGGQAGGARALLQ
jgi:hypothetical protein